MDGQPTVTKSTKTCYNCKVDSSPKWWPLPRKSSRPAFEARTNSQRPISDSSFQATNNQPHASNAMASVSPLPVSTTMPFTNGSFNPEAGSAPLADARSIQKADEVLYQCHKCHVMKRPPPPPSPRSQIHSAIFEQQKPVFQPTQLFSQPTFSPPHSHHAAPRPNTTPWSPVAPPSGPPLDSSSATSPTSGPRPQPPPIHNMLWRPDPVAARKAMPSVNGTTHEPSPFCPPAPAPPLPMHSSYALPPPPPQAHAPLQVAPPPPQPYRPPNGVYTPFPPSPYSQHSPPGPPPPPQQQQQQQSQQRQPFSASPPLQYTDPRNGVPPPRSPQATMQGPPPQRSYPGPPPSQLGDPFASHSRSQSYDGKHRPETPAEAERERERERDLAGSGGGGGASASPNLRNLLS
jgi:hypothetical protein